MNVCKILRSVFLAVVLVVALVPGAQALNLVRDAEIERTLKRISRPLFQAAGLSPAAVKIYIVNDDALNAFVAGGQNIFLYSGLLVRLETIDQLRAVIAHEVGHIAGGHLTRRNSELRGAKGIAAIGALGAIAATIAGSPEAGVAIAFGSGSVANRKALQHSRSEEAGADQAALRYLAVAGSSPSAMLEVLAIFRGQDIQRSLKRDPYTQTHPMNSARIALINDRIKELPGGKPGDPDLIYWHERMRAKFEGFLKRPSRVLAAYPESNQSEPAVLARAIAYHRFPDISKSLEATDRLLEMHPEDPYYHEMKGQFLLESGNAKDAVTHYERAVELAPTEPQILGGLGRALLNLDNPEATTKARDALAKSARYDKANTGVLRDLALAEARLGNDGAAALATAERYMIVGRFTDASRNAVRASDLLTKGSPGWRKAQDVLVLTRRIQPR